MRYAWWDGEWFSETVTPLTATTACDLALDGTGQPRLACGGETTLDLLLQDASGAPVADAEVAVVVVDEAILALSRAFTALKDYPMAQDLYRWVLEEMPARLPKGETVAAHCELGRIYENRGDNSSAYDAYRNALEIDPDFAAAREGIKDLLPDPSNHS